MTEEPADEAWLPWEGGECPVAPETDVEVKLQGGSKQAGKAGIFAWRRWLDYHDIVAYRSVSAAPSPAITSAVAAAVAAEREACAQVAERYGHLSPAERRSHAAIAHIIRSRGKAESEA